MGVDQIRSAFLNFEMMNVTRYILPVLFDPIALLQQYPI